MAHTSTVHRSAPATTEHPRLRLEPIEKPRGLLLGLVYRMARKQFGTTPDAIKVIFPRVPGMLRFTMAIQRFGKRFPLDEDLRELVHMQVSAINGCGFCMDLGRMMAVKQDRGLAKLNAVPEYKTSPLFTQRERAAIAYAEDVTLHKRPSDDTFATLREHFTDDEIAQLTVFIALVHFFNMQNVPLGIGSAGLCTIAQARKA